MQRDGYAHAGAAAVIRLRDYGRYLMAVQSQQDPEGFQFYISAGSDARVNPNFLMYPANLQPVPWVDAYQNINFIQECSSTGYPNGRIYMIGTYNTDVVFGGNDVADLFEVTFPSGYSQAPALTLVDYQYYFQCTVNNSDWCSFGAAAGSYVSPAGQLILYSTYFWRDIDGDGVLKVVEF